MKRVKSACICQTLHFQLNENVPHSYAVKLLHQEVQKYKESLIKSHTLHKIIEETVLEDDSVLIKIIKQYNSSPVGDYLN